MALSLLIYKNENEIKSIVCKAYKSFSNEEDFEKWLKEHDKWFFCESHFNGSVPYTEKELKSFINCKKC